MASHFNLCPGTVTDARCSIDFGVIATEIDATTNERSETAPSRFANLVVVVRKLVNYSKCATSTTCPKRLVITKYRKRQLQRKRGAT